MTPTYVFSDMTGGTGRTGDGALIDTATLVMHAAAIGQQLLRDYSPAWDSAPYATRFGAPGGADVGDGERLVGYFQDPDVAGAAGYHATTPNGKPYCKVFLSDAATLSSGAQAASVIASHEVLETSGDPGANLFAARADGQTVDALEMCDAVEDTTYTSPTGIELSNFLLPAAFDPGAPGPWDFLKVLSTAYDTTPGGYRITATIVVAADGSAKLLYVAKGPGLLDPAKHARKTRLHSRMHARGVDLVVGPNGAVTLAASLAA